MKLRESGMPEETYWESLFNIELILDSFSINSSIKNVAELGCGYGTFTIPVAKRTSGTIETIDIDSEMVKRIIERAQKAGIKNINASIRDVLVEGFPGEAESKDACLLFNILHGEDPIKVFREATRIVRLGSSIFVIHWRYDIQTPRGPDMKIRPRPEQIVEWAKETMCLNLKGSIIDLPPWHYGLWFKRIK